ncbi:MAG: ribonuclease J [Cyanobacteria bacterium]|nr:ribonuclease J [Cyanobacteriota bacterium]MDA1020859.1 ribonuclease J [Cyanobacteriota bacterium]
MKNKSTVTSTAIPRDPTKIVKVISLGGLYEIGKNTWVYECGDDIILIDAGLAFPTVDMIGVDIVLPKLNYIIENKHRIRALVLTHGHEDHIGGVVPMLKEVNIPIIYGPPLALALLKAKLAEAKISGTPIKQVADRAVVSVGDHFTFRYLRNNHSIADSFTLIIETPAGRIIHSGDFKFDHSPIDGNFFDIAPLAKAGEDGVTLLISDSTNAEKPTYTPSEKAVIPKLKDLIVNSKRRCYITTFASQVHRVKLIMELVLGAGKKLALFGRSMINLAAISRELGYISIPDNFIVKQEDVHKIPPGELVILSTGSQGEQFAALSRIARKEHKYLKVEPGDTVVMSSSPIPGNEKSVNNLINLLSASGGEVIYGAAQGIHVSGHASREEQKLMISLAQPEYFMPCHGEYRMLVAHGQTGIDCGVDPEKIFLMDNGDVLEMQDGKCKVIDKVEAGIIMVDNANVGELDTGIMLERRMVASEGMLTIVMVLNAYGDIMSDVKIYSRGIILSNKEKALIETMQKSKSNINVKEAFYQKIKEIAIEAVAKSPHNPHGSADKKMTEKIEIAKIETDVKSEIHRFVDDKMHRHPLLEVMVMEYTGKAAANVVGA